MRSKLMTGAMGVVLAVLAIGSGAEANGQGYFGFSVDKHRGSHHGRHHGRGTSVSFGFGVPIGQPAPVCAPVHVHSSCCQTLVPGHYEMVCEQVWVPGQCRQVWIEAVYATQYDCHGHPYRVLVTPGHYQTVQDPGRYESIQKQVWIADAWKVTCGY